MQTKTDTEYRLDARARDGKITRLKLLTREGSGEFRPRKGDFSTEEVCNFRKLTKAVSQMAKSLAVPLDLDKIVRNENKRRTKKRKGLGLRRNLAKTNGLDDSSKIYEL